MQARAHGIAGRSRWVGLGGLLLLTACSSARPDTVTYCDVQPIVEARCVRCHAVDTQNGAPFSLATYAATRDTYEGRPIYEEMGEVVTEGSMPPTFLDVVPEVLPLTDDEIALIEEWALSGAPSGGCQ